MKRLKRNPYFYSMLALLVAATLGGVWQTSREMDRLGDLKLQFQNKQQELSRIAKLSPAPTKANLSALSRNYNRLYEEYQKIQSVLNLNTYNRDLFFGQPPQSHNEAFFMIAKYVEDSRGLAYGSGVKAPSDYRYGFHQYENSGPEGDAIVRVHKQVKVMEALLQALFDSGIREFVSIKRELPTSSGAVSDPRSDKDEDFFAPARNKIGHESKLFDSMAFRLEFEGQSLSLRSFLNRVTSSSLPFAIREIEVSLHKESGSAEERVALLENPFLNGENAEEALSALRVPIIAENESRFVVALEFLELSEEALAAEDAVLEGEGSSV